MSKIAVVYLARYAEGVDPIRRFIDSYSRHPAGVAHDLVVAWKGFPNRTPTGSPQERICDQVAHRSIAMTDEGFDITAYKIAAETLHHDYICFLNTFSEIESDCWLRKLYDNASRPEIGIAGATGSFESIRESMKGMSKAVWLCMQGMPYDPAIAEQWGHEIVKHAPHWLERRPPSLYRRARRFARRFLSRKMEAFKPADRQEMEEIFEAVWTNIGARYARFPTFPNPHIRSNAFMMRRLMFLDVLPSTLATKEDCFEFESGHTSMSNRINWQHMTAAVVGRDGNAYQRLDWSRSRTFRSGAQENNLVSDNQTRDFDTMSPARRKLMERWTWYAPDNPTLDLPHQLPNPMLPLKFQPDMFI